MATSYYYKLNDGDLTIIVVDEFGALNTWDSTPNDCLVVGDGLADKQDVGIICKTGIEGHQPVLTLKGASWDSKVGDTGDVETTELVGACHPTAWELPKIV